METINGMRDMTEDILSQCKDFEENPALKGNLDVLWEDFVDSCEQNGSPILLPEMALACFSYFCIGAIVPLNPKSRFNKKIKSDNFATKMKLY